MPSVLLSGPAGAGKSQMARRLIAEADRPMVAADFQSIVVALLQLRRGPDGRYPIRPEWVLPMAEHIRREVIDAAVARDIDVVATNSDGDPDRRGALLKRLGPGATERIVDPGEDVVKARLADAETGELEPECAAAIGRWHGRLR